MEKDYYNMGFQIGTIFDKYFLGNTKRASSKDEEGFYYLEGFLDSSNENFVIDYKVMYEHRDNLGERMMDEIDKIFERLIDKDTIIVLNPPKINATGSGSEDLDSNNTNNNTNDNNNDNNDDDEDEDNSILDTIIEPIENIINNDDNDEDTTDMEEPSGMLREMYLLNAIKDLMSETNSGVRYLNNNDGLPKVAADSI
jgi:hypothetical protein